MTHTEYIGPFDIYNSDDDQAAVKNVFEMLFSTGEELYFIFSREEFMTDTEELDILRERIYHDLELSAEIKFLRKLDSKRFDAIARINLKKDFSMLLLDMMKYYFFLEFFKPINDLTFDEFEDYLLVTGLEDLNGRILVENKLTNFICIKGYDADHLIITYNTDFVMPKFSLL